MIMAEVDVRVEQHARRRANETGTALATFRHFFLVAS
jgi:hypothetical protein